MISKIYIPGAVAIVIEIPLDKFSKIPLYRQIAMHLERMIKTGSIGNGTKLPGTREMALYLGVSRTTVLRAYECLEGSDNILQKGRSGAYVKCEKVFPSLPENPGYSFLDMDSGTPSPDLVPSAVLSKLSRDLLLERGEEVLKGAPAGGLPELRKTLVLHAASRGIPASWEDVMVTTGGLESLSLSMKVLKASGVRRILMEELTYPEAVLIAKSLDLKISKISYQDRDLEVDLNGLSSTDALYLVPSFQNPTGRTLSQSVRDIILQNSIEKGYWVIEDDAYGELRYGESSVPALKAMNGSSRVVYTGSFSQPLFPGLRLGYSLVPGILTNDFMAFQSVASGAVSSLVQYIVLDFIKEGFFSQALDTARATIHDRMCSMGEFLKEYLPRCKFSLPLGGIYLWLQTPGINGDLAEKKALEQGVKLSSGNTFCWTGRKIDAVRLSLSTLDRLQLRHAARKLKLAWPELSDYR